MHTCSSSTMGINGYLASITECGAHGERSLHCMCRDMLHSCSTARMFVCRPPCYLGLPLHCCCAAACTPSYCVAPWQLDPLPAVQP